MPIINSIENKWQDFYHDFFAKHTGLEHKKDAISYYYYHLILNRYKARVKAFSDDFTPIIINNFNRCETLSVLVKWLLKNPKVFIIILDNNSDYLPLLKYYDSLERQERVILIQLRLNWGTRKLLPVGLALKRFGKYIITDPDLIPPRISAEFVIHKLSVELDKNPDLNHIGPSLEINDLPHYYPLRKKVIQWEKKFWQQQRGDLYLAGIATTFAMYRSNSNPRLKVPAGRLVRPFTFRHADWYLHPKQVNEEYANYMNLRTTRNASWLNEMRLLGLDETVPGKLTEADKADIKIFESYY